MKQFPTYNEFYDRRMYWNIEYKPYTETITFYKAMYKIWYAVSVFFPLELYVPILFHSLTLLTGRLDYTWYLSMFYQFSL